MGDVMSLDKLDKVKADTAEIIEQIELIKTQITNVTEIPSRWIAASTNKPGTSYQEVVNVSGSGFLDFLSVYLHKNSVDLSGEAHAYCKVIVDDKQFVLRSSSNNANRPTINFVCLNELRGNSFKVPYKGFSSANLSVNFSNCLFFDKTFLKEIGDSTTINTVPSSDYYVISRTPIFFKNNLSIQIKTDVKGTTSYVCWGYYLV